MEGRMVDMNKNIKNMNLLFYFIVSLFFMEIIFRISTIKEVFSVGLLTSFVFLTALAFLFYIICSLVKGIVKYILATSLLILSWFAFFSQMIYYKVFKTFYSLYSAGKAGQVFEFWNDIKVVIIENVLWLILLLLPIVLIVLLRKKVFSFKTINKLQILTIVFCFILFHIIGLATVYINNTGQYSAYDLYFNSSYPVFSAQKLGIFTTMRLDLQRLVSGWSPNLTVSTEYLPPEPIGKTDEEVIRENLQKDGQFITVKKKIEYNTMDINFDKLISNEKNEVVKEMHKYFKNVSSTEKNKYTGKYKGYNLILLTAEGFSPYAVHKDITPTLYKMVHEGYNFTNFYNPIWGVSTSDGEYVACTSLIPKNGVWSFYKSGSIYMPFVMGNQLNKEYYKTVAYHNHSYKYYRRDVSHPNMGYDYKGVGNGLNVKKTWPESDLEMMEKTIPEYIDNKPFHAYYMTVSGHMQYNFGGNYIAKKNKEAVKDLPYSEQAKAYIATQIELDKALEYLLEQLEAAGVADNTLIALSADHYPYGLENETIDEFAGHTVEKNFELYKSNFILYTKDMKPVTIDKPCSSLDIIPTISNLMGIEYDSRLLMGQDIFSDSEPLVMFVNKSFITSEGFYNSKTNEFIANEGILVDKSYIKRISSIIDGKFYYSAKILENDYYSKVFHSTN